MTSRHIPIHVPPRWPCSCCLAQKFLSTKWRARPQLLSEALEAPLHFFPSAIYLLWLAGRRNSHPLPTNYHPLPIAWEARGSSDGATSPTGKISAGSCPSQNHTGGRTKCTWKSALQWKISVLSHTEKQHRWQNKSSGRKRSKDDPHCNLPIFSYSLQSLLFFPSLAGIYERLLRTNIVVTVKRHKCRVL